MDAEGEVIATLREGRFQALRAKNGNDLAAYAIAQRPELATEPTAIAMERGKRDRRRDPSGRARLPSHRAEAPLAPGHLLLEGWATSMAYRLAEGLQRSGTVAIDDRVPEAMRPWLLNALFALESSGLATLDGERWTLRKDVSLPAPDEIMRWIAADHPELSAELVLTADIGAVVGRLLAGDLTEARPSRRTPSTPSSCAAPRHGPRPT